MVLSARGFKKSPRAKLEVFLSTFYTKQNLFYLVYGIKGHWSIPREIVP